MNLGKKKSLSARTLNIGKDRIQFIASRLEDIKQALSKADIRDLFKDGAIKIKPIKGKKKVVKRKRRGPGKIKKKINQRKQEYVKSTRKLRAYVAELKKKGELNLEEVKEIRKKIRNRRFKSKAQLKIYIKNLKK